MSRARLNEIVVGLFVLSAVAVFFYMTFKIKGSTGSNPYELVTSFPDVGGLELGAPVLVAGFRLGRVQEMIPGRGEDGRSSVVVKARISRTIPVYKNAKVHLKQLGFIGDKRLEIDPGTPDAGEIEVGDTVEGVPFKDFMEVFAGNDELIADVRSVMGNIKDFTGDEERIGKIDLSINHINESTASVAGILEENRAAIQASTRNVEEVTRRSIEISEKTEALLDEARLGIAETNKILAQVREDQAFLRERLERILAKAEEVGGNANELLLTSDAELKTLSARIQAATVELTEILEKINKGQGTAGVLVNDDTAIRELQDSLTALKGAFIEAAPTLYDRTLPYSNQSKNNTPVLRSVE